METLNIQPFELMLEKIKAIKENVSATIATKVAELTGQKNSILDIIKESAGNLSNDSLMSYISEIQKLDLAIINAKSLTSDDIMPEPLFLFDGQLYQGRKIIVGRVKNSNGYKFANGDKVQMVSGEHKSEVYVVVHPDTTKKPIVKDLNGKTFNPSKLTELFYTQILGKQLAEGSKGMAGLSHAFWVKVNETETTTETNN